MPGDISKEGIGYEEQVLTFLLCAPYEYATSEYVDFSARDVRAWEINPKLFNSTMLQIPFSIDIDFFIKKNSVYHVFFCKSSRKLAKKSPKEFLEKALATFCVLESRKKRFKEEFKYYYFSDVIPWNLVQTLPIRSNKELAKTLLRATGCKNTKVTQEMFSDSIIAFVKQKTRFCEVGQDTINERKARFRSKFGKILSKVAQAKRGVEEPAYGFFSEFPYQISIGDIDTESGRPYNIGRKNVWIGHFGKQLIDIVRRFEKSVNTIKVVKHLLEKADLHHHQSLTERESLEILSELLNEIVLPEAGFKETSLLLTPNNYDMVLFKHKKIAESIWKEIDLKAGKYDLSKVSILKDLDMKTASRIALIAFSRGRGIDLPESQFIGRNTEV